MRNRIFYVAIIISLLLSLACSEHNVQPFQPGESNGRVTAFIHGQITDYCSQALFASGAVTVTWATQGKTKSIKTDELGYYAITDKLTPGEFTITFSGAAEYAASRVLVTIPTLDSLNLQNIPTSEDYQYEITRNIILFKKNAGLKGRLYKVEDAHNKTPAAGVTVVADYSLFFKSYDQWSKLDWSFFDWFDEEWYEDYDVELYWLSQFSNIYPGKFTTVSDENGFFTLDTIPGAPYVFIYTLPYMYQNIEYRIYHESEGGSLQRLYQDAVAEIGEIKLYRNTTEPFIVHDNFINVDNFGLTDSLVVKFSKKMQLQTVEYLLKNYESDDEYYGNTISCDTTWTDSLTLTIKPKIPLRPDLSYSLDIMDGLAFDNHAFVENAFTFKTREGIRLISTNMERVEGVWDEFQVDQPITLTFNTDLDLNALTTIVKLTDQDDEMVYTTFNNNTASNVLTIVHADTLEWNQKYTLEVNIHSNIIGDEIYVRNNLDPFVFWTTKYKVKPPAVTGFAPIDAPGVSSFFGANWNTRTIWFKWNTVAIATDYIIYAKDSYKNSDWVEVGTSTHIDYQITQEGLASLPSQFDYFENDNPTYITPFLKSTGVTFAVAAVNNAGQGPLVPYSPIYDTVKPSLTLVPVNVLATADNSTPGSNPKIIEYVVTADEYVNALTPSIVNGDGSDPYFIPSATITYTWDTVHQNKFSAIIHLTVPGEKDGSGDILHVIITDLSNNQQTIEITLN
ncbi:Ig-like domain-containing protein [bacterium]|nr:Ig-like domain-containing protein [bacterium]